LAPLLVGVRYDRRHWFLVLATLVVLGGYLLLRAGAVPVLVPFDARASLTSRLAAAVDTFGLYVRMFFWPFAHHAWYQTGGTPPVQVPNIIAAVLLGASAVFFALKRRFVSTLWGYAWSIAFLLPVTSVATIGPTAAERLLMLPSAGLVMVLVTALSRVPTVPAAIRRLTEAGLVVVIMLLGADTMLRTPVWRNNETLFTAMVREAPTAPSAYSSLADAIVEQRPDSALALYAQALRLDPDYVHAHLHTAIILSDKGNQRGAIEHLRAARALVPNSDMVLNNLALAFRDAGEIDSALATIDHAIAVQHGGSAVLHLNRASVLISAGSTDEAAEELGRVLALDSTVPGARSMLAGVLRQQGRYDSAIAVMQAEVRCRPSAESFTYLGDLFISTGDSVRAGQSYNQAFRLDPAYVPALYNRSVLAAARGDPAAARMLAERAYQLRPDIAEVRELYFQLVRLPGP
ncbi:tetratricopeptide repeat protein, partial [candidate division WOR-3 bacterium]|nr:tetratricopeptide repeat protein [candidate division WOR-3 bacterium]